MISTRDAIFRKMTNRNQTDTNEMTTTETKYETDFYSVEKYIYLTKLFRRSYSRYRKKYQELWVRNTKNRFGIVVFLVDIPNFSLPIDIININNSGQSSPDRR